MFLHQLFPYFPNADLGYIQQINNDLIRTSAKLESEM